MIVILFKNKYNFTDRILFLEHILLNKSIVLTRVNLKYQFYLVSN